MSDTSNNASAPTPARRQPSGPPSPRTRKPRGAGGDPAKRERLIAAAGQGLTSVIVVVVAGSALFARGALERYVASTFRQAPTISIYWPRTSAERPDATYVPDSVRTDLMSLGAAGMSASPFDRAALEKAGDRLSATGWFARGLQVKRLPGNVVRVDGAWRVPAAVVNRDGRSHLVATDGSVLRLPEGAEPPEGLFTIANPSSPAPLDARGEPAYGVPWLGNDVQSAISLLRTLCQRPVTRQIAGIDLSDFSRSGKLILITDKGTRIVWGSAIGETIPGEVKTERKIARLEQNFKESGRIDANQGRIEIYLPIALVDKTARADSGS